MPAAMGMPIKLYMNAQNKFWRMADTVCRESLKAFGRTFKSEVVRVILATSMAISEPFPIAMLTSACANA